MLATIYVKNQDFEGLVCPEMGLARGSSWTNLYIPYKFQTDTILKGNTGRQNILALIDIYSFLVTDLTLYLDTHPNCGKTIESLNKAKIELCKLVNYYQENFGILTIDGIGDSRTHLTGPWPWEDRF